MHTILFDFDSTLVSVESLEAVLRHKLGDDSALLERLHRITIDGMEGRIDFETSLSRRLALAAPTRAEVLACGAEIAQWLTPGIESLIAWLHERGARIMICSGGLRELIVPVAGRLGIVAEDVHAVRLKWDRQGTFAGLDPNDPFVRSKPEGMAPILAKLPGPKLAIGDGMTDYALFASGAVDDFIAFTQHARRESLIATGANEAGNVLELTRMLEERI